MADNKLELKKLREMLGSLPSQSQVAPEEIIDALSYGAETPGQIRKRLQLLSGDLLLEKLNVSPDKDQRKTIEKVIQATSPEHMNKLKFDLPVSNDAIAEVGTDLKARFNLNKILSPEEAAAVAAHEVGHIEDIIDRPNQISYALKSRDPAKMKKIAEMYNMTPEKIAAAMDDPAFHLKAAMMQHHTGDLIKGFEPTTASKILSNVPLSRKNISKIVKNVGKGVKQIPLIGPLLGVGIAAATGDAEAAFPDIAAPTWTGPEKDSLQSIVENPEEALSMDEKEYKELIKAIRNQQE